VGPAGCRPSGGSFGDVVLASVLVGANTYNTKRYIHDTYNTHTYAFSACLGQYIPYIQHTCAYIQYIQYMHIWIEICQQKYIQDTYKIHTIHTHMH
jgi:hypothetical protein